MLRQVVAGVFVLCVSCTPRSGKLNAAATIYRTRDNGLPHCVVRR